MINLIKNIIVLTYAKNIQQERFRNLKLGCSKNEIYSVVGLPDICDFDIHSKYEYIFFKSDKVVFELELYNDQLRSITIITSHNKRIKFL